MRRFAMASLVAAGLLAGCEQWQMRMNPPPPAATQPAPSGQATYMAKAPVREDGHAAGESAVDTALEWAQKYAEAADKIARVEQDNRELAARNQKTAEQITRLQYDLNQARRELNEANDMLVELRTELERWKASVLGFRQEMRDAQQAQMKALAAVLKLLGGEAPEMPAGATTQPGAAKEPASAPSK